jgi:hypothetical protein
MEDSQLYCKYCGSEDLQRVSCKIGDNSSNKITVDTKLAKYDHGTTETQEILYDTFFCRTCRKIECETSEAPNELALLTINSINYVIVLPYALDGMLRTIKASKQDVNDLIEKLKKTIKKSWHYFVQNGSNPCKEGEIGFLRNIKIKDQPLHIGIIMDKKFSKGIEKIYVRIIYGGGRSICQ